MNNGLETRYFLSALTGAGYYTLHRQFLRPPERYFCILKGGPGCGKSTFLKRVGDAGRAAGLAVVRLHCAGDPASLDGVYFPEKRSGFFDGTAPHTVDPALFGASGEYLDLGTFCRTEALDTARLRKFVGPPLFDSFTELYGMQPAQAQAATERYRERYQPIGVYECEIYSGIPELLKQLCAAGFRVAVATGKPTPLARTILQRFDMERLFDCVIGCEYDGSRSTKAEVVAAALTETHTPPEAALMVGDRKYDVTGAAACGVPCLGVYYGYAEPGELEAAGAVTTVQTVAELSERLLHWNKA